MSMDEQAVSDWLMRQASQRQQREQEAVSERRVSESQVCFLQAYLEEVEGGELSGEVLEWRERQVEAIPVQASGIATMLGALADIVAFYGGHPDFPDAAAEVDVQCEELLRINAAMRELALRLRLRRAVDAALAAPEA